MERGALVNGMTKGKLHWEDDIWVKCEEGEGCRP